MRSCATTYNKVQGGIENLFFSINTTLERSALLQKKYEKRTHLGNVLVVVSDKKIQQCSSSVVTSYIADVVSANDYSAFHVTLAGRSYTVSNTSYRFGGAGGQEKDDEIIKYLYTAEHWEYDSRLSRRWNVDPVTYSWQSSYSVFNNCPISFVDPSGLEGEKPGDKRVTSDGCLEQYKNGAWQDYKPTELIKDVIVRPKSTTDKSSTSQTLAYLGIIVGGADMGYGKWKDGLDFTKYVTTKGKTRPIYTAAREVRSAEALKQIKWNFKINTYGLGLNIFATGIGYAQLRQQYKLTGEVSVVDATEFGIGAIGTFANAMSYLRLGGNTATVLGTATGNIGMGFTVYKAWSSIYNPMFEMQKFNTPTTNNPDEAEWNQKMNDLGIFNEGDLYGGN